MEEPKEILEQEVTVTKFHAKLYSNTDEGLELLLLLIFELLQLLKIDFYLFFRVVLGIHERLSLIEGLGYYSVTLLLCLINKLKDNVLNKELKLSFEKTLA